MDVQKNDNLGCLSRGFVNALEGFLDFAYANEGTVERKTMCHGIVLRIRCPCSKCQNTHHRERDDVKLHLMKYGFMPGYTMWWAHGETYHHTYHPDVGQSSNPIIDDNEGYVEIVNDQMVHDGMTWEEQTPNPYAQGFYDMLQAADEPLWDGCPNFSKLGAATRLLNWKAKHNVPVATYDPNCGMIKEMLPEGNKLPANFYETKKCLKKLALPKVKIDACKNHCMLFYKLHSNLTHCLYCKESRYKTSGQRKVSNLVLTYLPIVPRLQRLYMSKKTSKEMTWHKDHQTKPGVMVHPRDGEAWKRFDTRDPDFASEIRNVRLGLCTDGFNLNNSTSSPYSTWSVFLTIYNLPPWMCLKDQYVQLALVIPGRKSPGQNLDVFLRPLIDDLKMLYTEGVLTYDAYRKNNFEVTETVMTKPRGIYEVTETVNDVEVGENMEGEQFYQMNEMVTHTPSVGLNNDIDFISLVTGEVILVDAPNDDDGDDANEDSEEEAEFEDVDDDSDDENELILSDHSSDE